MPGVVVSVEELAAWLEDQGWRILREGFGRVTAERTPAGRGARCLVVMLHQDLARQPWMATLYRREPVDPPRPTSAPFRYDAIGKADGLVTTADVGLFLGGWVSHVPHAPEAA